MKPIKNEDKPEVKGKEDKNSKGIERIIKCFINLTEVSQINKAFDNNSQNLYQN